VKNLFQLQMRHRMKHLQMARERARARAKPRAKGPRLLPQKARHQKELKMSQMQVAKARAKAKAKARVVLHHSPKLLHQRKLLRKLSSRRKRLKSRPV